MDRQLYILHDTNPSQFGAVPVSPKQAAIQNKAGYGVFWSVNEFKGRRKKENLSRLLSWCVEIDVGEKSDQLALIDQCPVPPNLIVESKRGFQIYWNCRDATLANYRIILGNLQRFFGGDERALLVTQLMRAPGYLHMKDPENPFPVECVWSFEGENSERKMLFNFPSIPEVDDSPTPTPYAHTRLSPEGSDFWKRVYSLDCEEGLKRLSGTSYVNGEIYSFTPTGSGRLNILVNGKSTSSWIDSNKRIGSTAGGGPTLAQWLKYFGRSYREIYLDLQTLFPELQR